jgi:hypothetical protein
MLNFDLSETLAQIVDECATAGMTPPTNERHGTGSEKQSHPDRSR